MPTIVITQKNWNGKGDDRIFRKTVKRGQVAIETNRISRAYNLDHTEIFVEED